MSFETGDMASALPDVPNGTKVQATGPPKDQEAFDAARAKGWVEPAAYDYGDSQKVATSQAEAGEKSSEPQWAHEAAKYEWKDEYGEVGPQIPELEQQLFHDQYINRKGQFLNE